MSVKPNELTNREAGLPPSGTEAVQAEIAKTKSRIKDEIAERLEALEGRLGKLLARIDSATDAVRVPPGVENGREYGMGRDAAIHYIRGA